MISQLAMSRMQWSLELMMLMMMMEGCFHLRISSDLVKLVVICVAVVLDPLQYASLGCLLWVGAVET